MKNVYLTLFFLAHSMNAWEKIEFLKNKCSQIFFKKKLVTISDQLINNPNLLKESLNNKRFSLTNQNEDGDTIIHLFAKNGDHNSIAVCSSLTGKQLQQFKKALGTKNKKKCSPIQVANQKLKEQTNNLFSKDRDNYLLIISKLMEAKEKSQG